MPNWMTNRPQRMRIGLLLALGAVIVVALLLARPDSWIAMASLRADATKACKCARVTTDAKGKKACWTRFDKRIEKRPHSDMVSACDPISPEGICFDNGDCVVTQYDVVASDGTLCSQEEARIGAAVWNAAAERSERDKSAEDPDVALARAVEAFKRGDPVEHPGDSNGCASPPAG
jgi:hypothetical protein